jgi:putative FmdB family regulatory protein
MPLFEYKCKSCGRKFTALVGVLANAEPPACPACGSADLSKLISRFSATHTEDDLLESLADPDKYGDLEDPSAMRKFAKEMGKELGEDLEGDIEDMMSGADGESGGLDDETIY